MSKRSRKPADLNRLAASIAAETTDESPQEPQTPQRQARRAGGLKGGKARAEGLTAEQRSEVARKAAQARWSLRSNPEE